MGRILFLISLRNLWAHKVTGLIITAVIAFGTFLVVVGSSLMGSIDQSMKTSITDSFVGDIQIHAKDSRDKLEVFGGMMMTDADLGQMTDFGAIRASIEALDNVRSVIPMGPVIAMVSGEHPVDKALETLRQAVEKGDDIARDGAIYSLQRAAQDMLADFRNRLALTADTDKTNEAITALEILAVPTYWREFRLLGGDEIAAAVQHLEATLGPLLEDEMLIYLRILGTDLDSFAKNFKRFTIERGTTVPTGRRGLLLPYPIYERRLKNRVARELDRIHREVHKQGKSIAGDNELSTIAKSLPGQYRRVTRHLLPENADRIKPKLLAHLGKTAGTEASFNDLLQEFLAIDDANIDSRYEFFYQHIADHIRLYPFVVGDEIALRAVTKAGYFKAVKVRLYGVYKFKGLEDSDLAGVQNLVDLVSFRELYGEMTADMRAELADIRADVQAADIDRNAAEDTLFGGDDDDTLEDLSVLGALAAAEADGPHGAGLRAEAGSPSDDPAQQRVGLADTFDPAEAIAGMAVHAAVLLKDSSKMAETIAAIETLSEAEGFNIKAVDWQAAAGMIAQFIWLFRFILLIAGIIIFVVALVIINNSMMMTTLQRVPEIGAMRAIGAQRKTVRTMILMETSVLGGVGGLIGAGLGVGLLLYWAYAGIPAPSKEAVFFFSGPRLYPTFGAMNVLGGFFSVLVVSLVSAAYPAILASRVQPVVAMGGGHEGR